jgi:hypothetical protein
MNEDNGIRDMEAKNETGCDRKPSGWQIETVGFIGFRDLIEGIYEPTNVVSTWQDRSRDGDSDLFHFTSGTGS